MREAFSPKALSREERETLGVKSDVGRTCLIVVH